MTCWFVWIQDKLKNLGYPEYMRDRINAFKPGGHIAREMAKMKVAIQIGDTVLVHGGLRKKHVEYGMETLNGVTKRWLLYPGAGTVYYARQGMGLGLASPNAHRLHCGPCAMA